MIANNGDERSIAPFARAVCTNVSEEIVLRAKVSTRAAAWPNNRILSRTKVAAAGRKRNGISSGRPLSPARRVQLIGQSGGTAGK